MPRMRVIRRSLITPVPGVSILYPEGWEGLAPDSHIAALEQSGACIRLTSRRDKSVAPAGEPEDANTNG